MIAPDVRLSQISHLRRRTEPHEGIEHVTVERTVRLGIEFSVGKRPGAALAELNVARRIEHARFGKFFYVRGALLHPFAAFEDNGTHAVVEQAQRAEEPGGTRADDDDLRIALHARKGTGRRRIRLRPALHGIYPTDIGLIARVKRFFQDPEITAGRAQFFLAQSDERALFLMGAQREPRKRLSHRIASQILCSDAHAQCRLNPPHAPSTLRISPAKYSPRRNTLMSAPSVSESGMPPRVACA